MLISGRCCGWLASIVLAMRCSLAIAGSDELLTDDSYRSVKEFTIIDDQSESVEADAFNHSLVKIRSFRMNDQIFVRYQQYYQGLMVVGRSVVARFDLDETDRKPEQADYSGKVTKDIQTAVRPEYLTDRFRAEMIGYARENFSSRIGLIGPVSDVDTLPVIWVNEDNDRAHLAYLVSFKVRSQSGPVMWPHYVIDATDNRIYRYWNNIQVLHADQGPGGNNKTGKYRFGQGTMPSFSVGKHNNTCTLNNTQVKVITLNNTWYLQNAGNPTPFSYTCNENSGDAANGAFSPANDAYVFGNLVYSMYQNWYGQPVLALSNGLAKQLLILVHAGQNYENAYWDGEYLVFGDGGLSYHPLVSVSVVSHELSHAFTSQHSGLIYANQSGAINEAFSDMAAIAAEYYLKHYNQSSYNTIIGTSAIDWRIGDRVAKGNYAMRSMDDPSAYGSAECYQATAGCDRTWRDVTNAADQVPWDKQQSYIVHKGSGIMNRAFFFLVGELNGNVRKAFELMLNANMTYWTSTSTFAEAACGVKQVASLKGIDLEKVNKAFKRVGVTPGC